MRTCCKSCALSRPSPFLSLSCVLRHRVPLLSELLSLLLPSSLCFCPWRPYQDHIILLCAPDLSFYSWHVFFPYVLTLCIVDEHIHFLSQEIPVLGRDRNDFQEDSYSPSPPRNERTALRLPFPPLRSAVGGQGYLSRSAFSPWIVVPKHILASRKVVKSSCIFIKWFNMTSFTQGGYHSVPVDLPKNQLKSLLSAVHTPSVGTRGQSKMYCVCHLCGVLTLSFLLCYLYFLMGSQWYRGWGIRYPILPHVRHSFSCALAKRFLHS